MFNNIICHGCVSVKGTECLRCIDEKSCALLDEVSRLPAEAFTAFWKRMQSKGFSELEARFGGILYDIERYQYILDNQLVLATEYEANGDLASAGCALCNALSLDRAIARNREHLIDLFQ